MIFYSRDKSIRITLGGLVGKGGEGDVYEIDQNKNLVAKIFHASNNEKNYARERKLARMLEAPLQQDYDNIFIAWPTDLLYHKNCFAGYLMPRINNSHSLFIVFNPSARKQKNIIVSQADLLEIAKNLAKAVHLLHFNNYVIGDINSRNILVNVQNKSIALLDVDSFQVAVDGNILYCTVGVPEYTPPELQNENFRLVPRTKQHDIFGLTTLIFQVLMQGFYPFQGIHSGIAMDSSDNEISSFIRKGYFPYAYSDGVSLKPPPNAPNFQDLPLELQKLFSLCFIEGHSNPEKRPSTLNWIDTIEKIEREKKREDELKIKRQRQEEQEKRQREVVRQKEIAQQKEIARQKQTLKQKELEELAAKKRVRNKIIKKWIINILISLTLISIFTYPQLEAMRRLAAIDILKSHGEFKACIHSSTSIGDIHLLIPQLKDEFAEKNIACISSLERDNKLLERSIHLLEQDDNHGAINNLQEIFSNQQEHKEAYQKAKLIVEKSTDNIIVHCQSLLDQGNYQQALKIISGTPKNDENLSKINAFENKIKEWLNQQEIIIWAAAMRDRDQWKEVLRDLPQSFSEKYWEDQADPIRKWANQRQKTIQVLNGEIMVSDRSNVWIRIAKERGYSERLVAPTAWKYVSNNENKKQSIYYTPRSRQVYWCWWIFAQGGFPMSYQPRELRTNNIPIKRAQW
jgi:serine/threonine protein kinase